MMDLHTSLRRLTLAMVGAIGISFLLPISNARATGINDNIGKGADIMMKELRWPRWDAGTYYCQWYSYQSRKAGKDELLAPGLDSGGITCVQPDLKEENTLYVCNRDGILKSIDHGKSYTVVYRSPPKR